MGRAVISGVTTVRVDVTDISHGFASPQGTPVLESSASGPLQLLDPATSTGEQLLKCTFSATKVGQGMVHGTLQSDITDENLTVDVAVIFSLLQDVQVGDIVTAQNVVGYSGSIGGDAIVWYHGDGTGNEDGTYTLMGARCPE
jgi:hypothetical protein